MSRATAPTPRHPSRPDTPTPQADPTPRHPDTPRKVLHMQTDARGCKGAQGDARGCKGMQGDASDKARREGVRARGKQRGQGAQPKGAKSKALALIQRGLMLLRAVFALMLFCALGCTPCPLCFLPLALTPSPLALAVAFPSHSPCIPLAFPLRYPLAFPSHSVCICSAILGVSGCRGVGSAWGVGVSGRLGCRGVGAVARLTLSLPPCPSPEDLPPSPPSPPLPEGGSYIFYGCSFGKLQPFLSLLIYAVGPL